MILLKHWRIMEFNGNIMRVRKFNRESNKLSEGEY